MTDYVNVSTRVINARVLPSTGGGYRSVKVLDMTASADMDRVPYTSATVRIAPVDADTWGALNPTKTDGPASFEFVIAQHEQVSPDTFALLATIPARRPSFSPVARMVIRRLSRNRLTGEITLTVAGRETLMDDKKRISTSATNTGATTVGELVYWSLYDVFGSVSMDGIAPSNAIPAGDRRFMLPGESHSQLIEPELDAIDMRLWDYWGWAWSIDDRANPPRDSALPAILEYATFPGVSGADPIITNIEEAFDRDGDWSDAVMLKGSYTDGAGTRHEWTQIPSGGGVNTKGKVVTRERPLIPGLADRYTFRSKFRGAVYEVTARVDLALSPGQRIRIHTPSEVIGGGLRKVVVRSVEWTLSTGQMKFTACDEGLSA